MIPTSLAPEKGRRLMSPHRKRERERERERDGDVARRANREERRKKRGREKL
jgi:hypothetical protein